MARRRRSLMHEVHRSRLRQLSLVLWCAAWPAIGAMLLLPLPNGAPAAAALLAHALLFAGMAFAALGFCRGPVRLALVAALTFGIGAGLELAQEFVPHRTFDPIDALANAIGAALGYLAALITLYVLVRPVARRRRSPA